MSPPLKPMRRIKKPENKKQKEKEKRERLRNSKK
jgi:hypothetical protein